MPKLDFRRRPITSDHCGRIFFCAHPEDTAECRRAIDDVLKISDCIACFDCEPRGAEDPEWRDMLSEMQLFVVMVSRRFLGEASRARDVELSIARELHIPILPILTESVALPDYNAVFPDIQYLDPEDSSDAALPYAQKLERALGEVLQSSSTRAKIRDSFDRSCFLSYRKKDRRNAQRLLNKIHSNEKFQSVSIWYDEFLLPGEDFNHSIEEAMNSSSLFLMSVTPNMLEPTNYVMNVEFPAAREKEMQIVAVETQSTSPDDFSDKFDGAPPLVPIDNDDALFSALDGVAASSATEGTPERTYYLGLAYLGGISVEVNRPLGVRLIADAAERGHMPALQKLISMYRCGDGVARDYGEVIRLRSAQIDRLLSDFKSSREADDFEAYLSALLELAGEYQSLGDYDSARRILNKTRTEADSLRNTRALSIVGHAYMRIAVQRLAVAERLAGNTDEAIMILKSNLPFFRFELEESGSKEDKRALAVLLQELANLYAEKGNTAKSEKFANEAMALNEEIVGGEGSNALDRYNLGVNLFNKAISLSREGNTEAAINTCFSAMEVISAAMDHRESYALYVRAHLLLGEQYESAGKTDDAKLAFAKAIDVCDSPSTPQDIVTLKLKAEALTSLGRANLSQCENQQARQCLRSADKLYEEIISQFDERKLYHKRAEIAFLDAQICYSQHLFKGAGYNYEKCIEYMEKYTEEAPEAKDLNILALASYLLGSMNRGSPDIPLLKKAFTIWSELAKSEGGEEYAKRRDEVAAILVRHML